MANEPIPQGNNHQDSAGNPESFNRLAGLLAEVSSELRQLRSTLQEEAPAGEGPIPEARTPDPPADEIPAGEHGTSASPLSGGEPVDTSFAPPRAPVAQVAGVSRFAGTARWPGWFAAAAALCGAALLVVTAAACPTLLSPAQIVGGFALGAGLFGLWSR
jgi:hypothetical protein